MCGNRQRSGYCMMVLRNYIIREGVYIWDHGIQKVHVWDGCLFMSVCFCRQTLSVKLATVESVWLCVAVLWHTLIVSKHSALDRGSVFAICFLISPRGLLLECRLFSRLSRQLS